MLDDHPRQVDPPPTPVEDSSVGSCNNVTGLSQKLVRVRNNFGDPLWIHVPDHCGEPTAVGVRGVQKPSALPDAPTCCGSTGAIRLQDEKSPSGPTSLRTGRNTDVSVRLRFAAENCPTTASFIVLNSHLWGCLCDSGVKVT